MVERTATTFQSRTVRIAVQVFAAVVLFATVAGLATFRRYVEESPRFCQTCHVVAPEIAVWMESEHRTVRCQQCHHQTLEDGLHILTTYAAGKMPERRHAEVDVRSCASCHASHDDRWPSIADSIGHTVHTQRAELPCTACHGAEMHFDQPARVTCLTCHEDKVAAPPHEERHCLACHNFLSTEDVIRPQRRDCMRCHRTQEKPVSISDTAPMQFACAACHRPHSDTGVTPCTECHKRTELAGLHDLPGHAECGACHAPHEWVATKAMCRSCHKGMQGHHPGRRCSDCHSFESLVKTGP